MTCLDFKYKLLLRPKIQGKTEFYFIADKIL